MDDHGGYELAGIMQARPVESIPKEQTKSMFSKSTDHVSIAQRVRFESVKHHKFPQNRKTYDLCAEYKISKEETKRFGTLFDTYRLKDPVIEYERECILLDDNERKLLEKREENVRRREILDQYWSQLADDEKEFRDSFIKFNDFVLENKSKRERASKKIDDHIMFVEKKNADIKTLMEEINKLKTVKESVETSTKKYMIYESYLSKVISQTEDFVNVTDVLQKFESLMKAKEELAVRDKMLLRVLHKSKTDMVAITDKLHLDLMGLQNKAADLREKYKLSKINMLSAQCLLEKVNKDYIMGHRELSQVKKSVLNLFRRLNHNPHMDIKIDEENFEEMLIFIKKAIIRLVRLNKFYPKKARKQIYS